MTKTKNERNAGRKALPYELKKHNKTVTIRGIEIDYLEGKYGTLSDALTHLYNIGIEEDLQKLKLK